MLVLLPRFLVLELLFFTLIWHQAHPCISRKKGKGRENQSCYALQGHGRKRPLFLQQGQFLMPYKEKTRLLADTLTALCPGARLSLDSLGLNTSSANLKCMGSNTFSLSDIASSSDKLTSFNLASLQCSRVPRPLLKTSTIACGNNKGAWYHLLWPQTKSLSWPQLSICFDIHSRRTHFVNHTLMGDFVEDRSTLDHRPAFKEAGLYRGIRVDQSYKRSSQRALLKHLLGEEDSLGLDSMVRGHLAPDADFVLQAWQEATYYFINVAPQLRRFNSGNWFAIERAVRNLAHNRAEDFQVITGTLDDVIIEDRRGRVVPLELRENLNDAEGIPVPKFFFKAVLDKNNFAIVFVGHNFLPEFFKNRNESDKICRDVCEEGDWIFPHQHDINRGIIYCCHIEDFMRTVPWLPVKASSNGWRLLRFGSQS